MTIPYLMNCEHSGEGWCLECVGRLRADYEELRDDIGIVAAALRNEQEWEGNGSGCACDANRSYKCVCCTTRDALLVAKKWE